MRGGRERGREGEEEGRERGRRERDRVNVVNRCLCVHVFGFQLLINLR